MKCSVERLIEALVGAELARDRKAAEQRRAEQVRATYVVAVSRGYGALGQETAQALADTLGVRCCDRAILQEVAERADVDVELVRRLDERLKNIRSDWWLTMFGKRSFPKERYLNHLVKVVLNISLKGGVIVGRGAHLILGPERCFRVRIIGSLRQCAQRISAREGVDFDAAVRRVEQVDRERAEYLDELYGVRAADSSNFDLVLNTDRYTVDQAVAVILAAMQQAGYDLKPVLQRAAAP
jgi:cytidylate kinase